MNWQRQQGKLYPPHPEPTTPLVIATGCRHPIHPGNDTQVVEACPVCVMRQCIEAMSRIWKVWEILGAPDRRYSVSEDETMYFKVKALWRVEKQRWSNLVAKYDEMGEREEAWEESGMQEKEYTFEELNSAQSCRAALQLAWTMNPVELAGYDVAFEPRRPLTRKAGKPSVPNIVTPLMSLNPPMRASPPVIPSTPPHLHATGLDKPPPIPPSTEQPTSSPSSPVLPPQLSPPFSPKYPVLELSENERSPSEFVPSETAHSSSLSASPPRSPVHRRKKVTFAEDVLDSQKRPATCFMRGHPSYRRGRQACPSMEGWADSSFKNDKKFWRLGPQDDIGLDNASTPYEQLLGDFRLRAERIVPVLEHDSDSDSDSDSDDDSDSSDVSDTDPNTTLVHELDSTLHHSPWLNSLYWPALEDSDSDSEPDIHFDSDEYEDEEAEDIMRMLNVDDSTANTHPYSDTEMLDAESQVEREPEAGDIGLQVLGRRDRNVFESDSLQLTECGAAKRQRRGSV
jgi:hypothetical protein